MSPRKKQQEESDSDFSLGKEPSEASVEEEYSPAKKKPAAARKRAPPKGKLIDLGDWAASPCLIACPGAVAVICDT